MGVSQLIYLLGSILFFNGILAKPSLIPFEDLAVEYNPKLIHSKQLEQRSEIRDSTYKYRVHLLPESGFTGFRSVFQLAVGSRNIDNYGINNAMEFTVKDVMNLDSKIFGDIGFYSNGSQIGVHFSVESAANSTAGPSFNCSNSFPLYNGRRTCFNANFSLISDAVYYLDVEISNNTVSGYISQPQTNFSNISNSSLTRFLIGEIKLRNEVINLSPNAYWISNTYESCALSNEVTTFNYLPEVYNKEIRRKGELYRSVLNLMGKCGEINALAMTDWSTVLYISRPTPIINGTNSTNF